MPQTVTRFWFIKARHWLEVCLELIFPTRCAGCGQVGRVWCQECQAQVSRISGVICHSCGRLQERSGRGIPCSCESFPFEVRSFAWYQGSLIKALVQLKYSPNAALARELAEGLAEVYRSARWPAALAVPVPLASERMHQRGYNQAALIASSLAHILSLPYSLDAVKRVRETRSQVGLSYADRRRNVRGAFLADTEIVQGRIVVIIDDLFTTGATMISCAQALLDAGARSIYGLTVGRARGMDG